jgi:ubiquinone biosynthesis protein
MRLFNLRRTIRDIRRYREIIAVLIRYGFDDIIDQLNINTALRNIRLRFTRKDQKVHAHKSRPERVRMALEELGPTFIKLGQMLSTRYDLLPLEYLSELRKLQDEVQPFPSEQAVDILELELEKKVEDLFVRFESEPVAAASIAQVHHAKTQSGEPVAVKIQRPDIRKIIETDIRILAHLADLIEKYIPESHVFDPSGLVSQFQHWINEELNFFQEGRNIHRFKKNFADEEKIYVPKIYWDLCTTRILTIEFIEGLYIDRVDEIRRAGMDTALIAERGTLFVLRQIFEHHFFHGDPHPSNLLILPGHVIAPLDYGLMGRMDNVLVSQVSDLLRGIIKNDAPMIVRTLIGLNRLQTDVDRDELRIDVSDLLARYHSVPLHMLKFEYFFNDLVKLVRDNGIQFPRSLYLMGKAQMIMEGIAQKLDPEFNIISVAGSYFSKRMIGRAEAEKFIRQSTLIVEDYADLLGEAPRTLNQILKKARWGDMGINLNHVRIDDMLKEIDRFANRLSFSLIIASLIVGSSLVINVDKGPRLWDMPVFGAAGYIIAGILGLWLVFSILRSRQI